MKEILYDDRNHVISVLNSRSRDILLKGLVSSWSLGRSQSRCRTESSVSGKSWMVLVSVSDWKLEVSVLFSLGMMLLRIWKVLAYLDSVYRFGTNGRKPSWQQGKPESTEKCFLKQCECVCVDSSYCSCNCKRLMYNTELPSEKHRLDRGN